MNVSVVVVVVVVGGGGQRGGRCNNNERDRHRKHTFSAKVLGSTCGQKDRLARTDENPNARIGIDADRSSVRQKGDQTRERPRDGWGHINPLTNRPTD